MGWARSECLPCCCLLGKQTHLLSLARASNCHLPSCGKQERCGCCGLEMRMVSYDTQEVPLLVRSSGVHVRKDGDVQSPV